MEKELTRKEKQITQLYLETTLNVGKSEQNWISFLKRASYNYKYRFDEQILLYAQRPDAIACAETEVWNKKLKRWINKGSRGVALITEKDGELGLRFVFDVSDTNSNKYGRKFKLWQVEENYNNDIIVALEEKFGVMEDKSNLPLAIISTVYNCIIDNMQDYLDNLKEVMKNSKLEKLEDKEFENTFLELLIYSTIALTMSRCGLDVKDYIQEELFSGIKKFNTFETMSILGTATRDFSKEILLEISKTVINVQKQEKNKNYTFEKIKQSIYNKGNEKGSVENEYNLHEERGLSNAKLNNREERSQERRIGQIRQNEIELSKNKQEGNLHDITRKQQINGTLDTNTENSNKQNRTDNGADEETIWNNRGIESQRPDGMGRTDEQHSINSRANSSEGDNLQQLNSKQTEIEADNASFFSEEIIKNIIQNSPNIIKNERQFREYIYENSEDIEKCKNYIKETLGDAYTEFEIDDKRVGYKVNDDNLNLWTGNYLNRTEECFKSWNIITDYCISNYVHYNIPQYNENTYTFLMGDTIYLGLQEFTVLDLDNGKMTMYDNQFPLDQRTVVIQDVLDKIAENPMNDYLRDRKVPEVALAQNYEQEQQKDEQIQESKEQKYVAEKIIKKNRNIEYFDLHPEIPTEERNNFKITDEFLGVGTEKEKYKNNIEAIKVLKLCEEQKRYATPEEQQILSKYIGWGGLKTAFEEQNTNWSSEYAELKKLLTEDEYKNAKESSLTAYYTPPIIIKNIYKALQNMGLKQANILEPSCRSWKFFRNVAR